jgi:hypothetical protein
MSLPEHIMKTSSTLWRKGRRFSAKTRQLLPLEGRFPYTDSEKKELIYYFPSIGDTLERAIFS